MTTKYDRAVSEVRSVLNEWLLVHVEGSFDVTRNPDNERIATAVVERLIAKGVIQSTDLDDLTPVTVRTGPLAPGRIIIGGDDVPTPGSVQRSES